MKIQTHGSNEKMYKINYQVELQKIKKDTTETKNRV
jgi:hypothetical protein